MKRLVLILQLVIRHIFAVSVFGCEGATSTSSQPKVDSLLLTPTNHSYPVASRLILDMHPPLAEHQHQGELPNCSGTCTSPHHHSRAFTLALHQLVRKSSRLSRTATATTLTSSFSESATTKRLLSTCVCEARWVAGAALRPFDLWRVVAHS